MNNITITGNLTKDAELRATSGGESVLGFSVADNQGKDKPAIFWNCQLWGKRAQSLQQYLGKGQQVTIVGSVTEREYTNKEGQKIKAMDVRVNDLALQGGKRDAAPSQAPRQQAPSAPRTGGSSGFDDMNDDVPFNDPLKNRAYSLAI